MRSALWIGATAGVLVFSLSMCSTLAPSPDLAAPPGTCGTGTLNVPPQARPWVKRAAEVSGIPEGWLAAVASRESDFDPRNWTPDKNGGTSGIWQLNQEEWAKYAPPGVPLTTPDPMIQADVAGKYFKARLDGVRQLQSKHKDAEWGKLPDLDALVIAHNAGEGSLERFPAIPEITKSYLAEIRRNFRVGPCEQQPGGLPFVVRPNSGKIVSPIPDGVTGVQMTARYHHYPKGDPHWGVDLAKSPEHSWTIQSVCDGVVKEVKINPGAANINTYPRSGTTNYLWIDCGHNVLIGYAHFNARDLNPALKPGVPVGAGTPLFPEGNQGFSSGPHLHLQVSTVGSTDYSSSATVDPVAWLAAFGVQLPKPNY